MRSKPVYLALLNERGSEHHQVDELAHRASRVFLSRKLEAAGGLICDLPAHVQLLPGWVERGAEHTGCRYQEYLAVRKAGGGRRYFSSKSHALYFLRSVAPTKLVDGAWLYGLLHRWDDARFAPLIRIYLEELGEGLPDKNHVLLYRKLLASHGCEQQDNLTDDHFTQGAIQLSLAHHAADFLPEVIGFNLGYEQLPLHLLITAYELNELGIDPYYFTLHVTVDNAASGHARKSVQGVLDALPRVGDANVFYRRLANGYKLNMLGAGTDSIIASFDLNQELLSVFATKAATGSKMHSDYCRFAGRTVNEWLSEPDRLPAFLSSMEQMGWIKRHQDPCNSRFWKLIHGERGEMFGVFNAYERQLIYDWIAGETAPGVGTGQVAEVKPRQLTFKARERLLDTLDRHAADGSGHHQDQCTGHGVREHLSNDEAADGRDDFNLELRLLKDKLALSSRKEAMRTLITLMSPANHHTAAGLMATRIFPRLFG
jgi:hypothetical protein